LVSCANLMSVVYNYTQIIILLGGAILPTAAQGLICISLCQSLTNFYRSVEMLRFDERDGTIFIFAGEELQIQVYRDGTWEYLI